MMSSCSFHSPRVLSGALRIGSADMPAFVGASRFEPATGSRGIGSQVEAIFSDRHSSPLRPDRLHRCARPVPLRVGARRRSPTDSSRIRRHETLEIPTIINPA